VGLLNPGGPIAQFKRNRCSISPVELILQSGVRSQELNIAQSTVYHWRKEFCSIETPQHTYTPKEFDAISRKLEKLEHEKEIIQLSGFLEKVPLKTKLAICVSQCQHQSCDHYIPKRISGAW
jgi:hypothetical protein